MSANKTLPGVNPVVQFFFIIIACLGFGLSTAHAADKAKVTLTGVTGFDGTGAAATDGPLSLGFSGVSNDGKYFVTASRVVAIFTADPGITGTTKHADTYAKSKSVWILKTLPAGSKLYAMGLGSDWAGNGPDIANIDLSKAKASGEIKAGASTLGFERPATERCRVVNWVVVLPDGKRAWGPNGADKVSVYHVHVGGKPATAWCFEGDKVVAMATAQRQLLAAQK
ncbi:MAG: hypothetical protein KA034_00540 [Candidatus Moranbacteria bacterium]|nr:hypothetical protein [Candidatus Moranbacteria bacterium]